MNAEKISKLLLPFVNTIFKFFQPKEAERLECLYEVDDPFDDVAIKTVNSDKVITGHFLGKISRVNKLLLDRGATAYAKLTSTHYRRSQIMQGGLEKACKITVKLHGSVKTYML